MTLIQTIHPPFKFFLQSLGIIDIPKSIVIDFAQTFDWISFNRGDLFSLNCERFLGEFAFNNNETPRLAWFKTEAGPCAHFLEAL